MCGELQNYTWYENILNKKNEALKISQVVDINGDINKEISANERQEGNGATTAHTIQQRPSISTLLK